jgi:hypothetical protein
MDYSWQKIGIFFVASLLVAVTIISVDSCRRARQLTPEERQQVIQTERQKLLACLPDTQPGGKVRLALGSIRNEPQQTSVTLVAYAVDEPVEFDVVQYSMSRGRWLINEKGRAYLRDEQCNEYKLKDRLPTVGKVPDSGRIPLKPGEVYELTLYFPRLLEEVKAGVLVYGEWVMPFYLK